MGINYVKLFFSNPYLLSYLDNFQYSSVGINIYSKINQGKEKIMDMLREDILLYKTDVLKYNIKIILPDAVSFLITIAEFYSTS